MSDVGLTMAGVYTCNARTDQVPPVTGAASLTLVVYYFPRSEDGALNKFAGEVGQSVLIRCAVRALPIPELYWQDSSGSNLTGNDYTIVTEDLWTSVRFDPLQSSHYGSYTCYAVNEVGTAMIPILLLEPAIPDAPLVCSAVQMTAHGAWLSCQAGYDGGASVDFTVYKLNPYIEKTKLDSNVSWDGDMATLYASGLSPNQTYTLMVHTENKYGESEDAYGVFVRTIEGEEIVPPGEFPLLLVIICASVGGVLLVVIITVIVCVVAGCCKCCKCCNREKKDAEVSNMTSLDQLVQFPAPIGSELSVNNPRKQMSSYFTDDVDNRLNTSRDSQFERRASYASFKKESKRSLNNLGYQPDTQSNSSRLRMVDYNAPQQPVYSVQLNHFPGESSDIGSMNHGYSPAGSAELSRAGSQQVYANFSQLSGSDRTYSNLPLPGVEMQPLPGVEMRRNMADPMQRAKRLSQEQPNLAGLGALVTGQDVRPNSSFEEPYACTVSPSNTGIAPNKGPRQPYMTSDSPPGYSQVQLALAPPEYAVPYAGQRQIKRAESIAPMNPGLSLGLDSSPRPPTFQPEVPWEFPRDKLSFKSKIGEGSFGEVWRARASRILQRPGKQQVAVKMLKDMFTPDEKRALLKELQIMKQLQPHPNIVSLLGCCTESDPICVIMEYASNGNLQDLLRRQRTAFQMNDLSASPQASKKRHVDLTLRDLTIFSLHICTGMEYITSQQLLHRDLAARNILVDSELVCKICDFGSARDIMEMRQYESSTQRRLPIRWMAPESLFNCEYSFFSDIWAFGVVLWEIVTLGSSPYPGMSGPDVMNYIQKGCRMSKPALCSDQMYKLMKDCWSQFPAKRPAFIKIKEKLTVMLNENIDNMFVDQMSENIYDIIHNQPGEKC